MIWKSEGPTRGDPTVAWLEVDLVVEPRVFFAGPIVPPLFFQRYRDDHSYYHHAGAVESGDCVEALNYRIVELEGTGLQHLWATLGAAFLRLLLS